MAKFVKDDSEARDRQVYQYAPVMKQIFTVMQPDILQIK